MEFDPWSPTSYNLPLGQGSKWLFCDQTLRLDQRFTILPWGICFSAMVMVKLGIFVVKFRGKILDEEVS